jgi:hypothetical protein
MAGIRTERSGDIQHCQGAVLAYWVALNGNNEPRGKGANVYAFDPHGKIASVTGFWA